MSVRNITPEQLRSEREAISPQWNVIFWVAVAVVVTVLLVSAVFTSFSPDQLIYLARNFAHGKLTVDDMPHIYPDYAVWQGHTYLPVGPLSAVILIPFLPFLEIGLQAGWISILFTLINLWLLRRLLRQIGVSDECCKWSLLLFFGGTVYFPIASAIISWHFAHILTTTWLLLAISESLGKKRLLLIGLLIGLAAMTRSSTVFTLPFFVWMLWTSPSQRQVLATTESFIRLRPLILGLIGPLAVLLLYNYMRFDNPLETGYGIDVVGSQVLEQAREQGLFSPNHIPKNLFMMLLQGPLLYPSADAPVVQFPYVQPSPWGMGIFFTSPALIFAFRALPCQRLVQACWISIISVLIPLLCYYAPGWIEFGYRYSLDFMLFLLLLAVRGFPISLTNSVRTLIVVSVLINLWGVFWLQHWL